MKRRSFIGTAAGAALTAGWAGGARPAAAKCSAPAGQAPGRSPVPVPGVPVPSSPPRDLRFTGDVAALRPGLDLLAPSLNFRISERGLEVMARKTEGRSLRMLKKGRRAEIRFAEKAHFFRGLGLLLQELEDRGEAADFDVLEEAQFTTAGAMFDVSQGNAVVAAGRVVDLLKIMAVMGLNMIMLYAEDSYEVPGEPFFGYMRGRYTEADLRAIDDAAWALGIEAIPCIQTLAHLTDVLQWDAYRDIKEDEDTLLVGEPGAYSFIEKMMTAAAAPFRTRRIHIGMDEAWKLGQGNSLKRYGPRRKIDLMTEHLGRVLEIARKHGLKPMIWSDMYFRAASPTGDYYDPSGIIAPEDIRKMPRDVQFVYWDYYHNDAAFYEEWIRRHQEFGSDPIFAGGIWGWQGFGLSYGKTFVTTNAALEACKRNGIREVFATIWGDATTECPLHAHLLGLQLYAEHAFARHPDDAKIGRRFKFTTGCTREDFWLINGLNAVPGVGENSPANPSRFLMWQDPLLGLFDKNVEGLPLEEHYAGLTEKLRSAAERSGSFRPVFEFYAKTSSVLAIKSVLGLKMRSAYLARDRAALGALVERTLPELDRRVAELREYHRSLWLAVNQPPGWEVMDLRYGALRARLDTARDRLSNYLLGRIERIPELELERRFWNDRPGLDDLICNSYDRIVSAGRLAYSWKM
jgi:hexosaminidase